MGGAATYGIYSFTNQTVIAGNTVHDCGGNGIAIQASSYVTVSDNLCRDNGAGQYGIQILTGCANLTVVGNTCTGAGQGGLRIAAACDRAIIANNLLYGNAGVNITGTGSLTNSVNVNNITA